MSNAMSPEKRKARRSFWIIFALSCIPLAWAIAGIVITYPIMYPTNLEAVTLLIQLSGFPLLIAIAMMFPLMSSLGRYNSIG